MVESHMNKSSIHLIESIGKTISMSRLAKGIKQSDLAQMSGIGINTIVSIEKGVSTVQIGHYIEVLSQLGIDSILSPSTDISNDKLAVVAMTNLLPKRVSSKHRF